ncbi:T9SS type A sorting domain-containing protein [Rhodocaloribacter litoris]|uniref:T9SS type A sorting domain-containing protein n=1 Tax=Rhodocaloribacter litoris TaxID=2558931 RepID=UPI00141EAE24|nr:T9SS type A sorting domain-containing protein [Rhodocaloribacter litoris]QXD13854.1 T9SS type A sorting domain-containing protein [Rhodocaloribacter litoris]
MILDTALGLQASMLSESTQPLLLEKLLEVFGDILKLTPDQARLRKADTDGASWFVAFDQVIDGIPVVGTEIGYTIDPKGNVVALGATVYLDLDVATTPALSKEAALAMARAAFALEPLRVKDEGTLMILPIQEDQGASIHLAWRVRLFLLTPLKGVTYFIDARDGTVLRDWSNLRHAHWPEFGGTVVTVAPPTDFTSRSAAASAAPLGGSLSGTVTGSYYPELVSDPPVTTGFKTTEIEVYDLIGRRVFLGSTSASGSWSTPYLASGYYTIRLPLQNEWVELHDANDNAIEHTATIWVGGNTTYNYNWTADDAPNVRYHASTMHDFFKASPFNYSGMDYQMNAYIDQVDDLGNPLNGAANGTEIFFGTQSGIDWARSSDVVNHKYAHNTIYSVYGNDFIATVDCRVYIHQSCAMDEGLSDYFAGAKNNDALIGEDVGVNRNLDNNSYKWTQANGNHWNGQVIGGAMWDVRQVVGSTIGDDLAFKALQITPHAYDFDAFRTNVITADNTYYGGIHVCAIQNAFSAHGVGTACPPLSASISGPSSVISYEFNTWTAVISGGQTPYTYSWEFMPQCPGSGAAPQCDAWNYGGNASTFTYRSTDGYNFTIKLTVTDAVGTQKTTTKYVTVTGVPKTGIHLINEGAALPESYALEAAYPNPFSTTTELRFAMPEAGPVTLVIYDVTGREVIRLVDGMLAAGYHRVRFNAGRLPSGVYLYRLIAGTYTKTRRMIFI